MPPKRPSGKRNPKTPSWLNDTIPESQKCEKWCIVFCPEEDRNHILSSKNLETDECDYVTEGDLQPGKELVWRYKGVPYTVEVLSIHDEKPKRLPKKQKARFPEDSSSDEESVKQPSSPKKMKKASCSSTQEALEKSESPSEKSDATQDISEKSTSPMDSSEKLSPQRKATEKALFEHNKKSDSSDEEVLIFNPERKEKGPVKRTGLKTIAAKLITDNDQQNKDPIIDVMQKLDQFERKISKKLSRLEQKCDTILLLKSPAQSSQQTSQANSEDDVEIQVTSEDQAKYTSESGVNLLSLRAVNCEKYALALMDALFSDEEMARCCFTNSLRSTKPQLPEEKTRIIRECIDIKFGKGMFMKNYGTIVKKCNQKCLDSNKRVKRVKEEAAE